jgi:lipoyl(octanoyl) transferase
VGYPLLDLARAGTPTMGIREYICLLQKTIEDYLHTAHGISHVPSEHTGVFLDTTTKIASIGVQVRHRLTTHGFALNVTRQPLTWFGQVVACGLDDVKAGCVEEAPGGGKVLRMVDEMVLVLNAFGRIFGREMVKLSAEDDRRVFDAISALETDAERMGECAPAPVVYRH